jgi:sigma-B regulation protein RsbU (phosphoserine phosphatase)
MNSISSAEWSRWSRSELEAHLARLAERNETLERQLAARESTNGSPSPGFLLQAMLDATPDRIYFKDRQARFLRCSRATSDRLGVTDPEQVVGKTDFDFLPEERARLFFDTEQRLMLTGETLVNEPQKLTKANGDTVWTAVTKVPLRDAAGKIVGLVGINRDITEHIHETEFLRRSRDEMEGLVAARTSELTQERRLLRTLIDHLPDAIYVKDLAGRKLLANSADLKNMGCPSEAEALGKTDFAYFPREVAEHFQADDQQVFHGEPVIDREEYIIDSNGRKQWLLTSKLPWHDAAGNIIGLVGIGRLITRRKNAEMALDNERRLLRTLVDNLPDCIYAKDTAGRKTLANPADLKNLRCKTEADAIGKNDFDLFPRAQAEKFWADDQRVLGGEPVINREEYFFDEMGEKRWLLTSKLPLHEQGGAVTGLIGIARDITLIKRSEEKLAEHVRELEQREHQTKEELNMARELQMAMLPQVFPSVPRHKPADESHLEFFSFFCPSGAVSGDFFDVVPLSDNAVGLFICDAMGHDVRAALVTAMMRALVTDLSVILNDPGELLGQMNRELACIFKQSGSIMYATAFYLIVDLARGEFRFASAAHPDPLLLRRATNTVEWLKGNDGGKKGPALGLFADGRFPTHRRALAAGDVVALFTDGLTEVEGANDTMYTAANLLAAVQSRSHLPSSELFKDVIEEIKHFAIRPQFDDDICLASVEVKRLDTPSPGDDPGNQLSLSNASN